MHLSREALKAGFEYLTKNPREILRQLRHAVGLRLAIPLDAVRWFLEHLPPAKRPKDLVLGSAPPAITVAATVDVMGTALRAGASVRIENVKLSPEAVRLSLRLADFTLEPLGAGDSPIAAFLKSGAIDLKKPGNLANMLPMRPAALVEAVDDLVVIDLLKVPKIAANAMVRKVLEVVSPLITLPELRTEDDRLLISWRPRAGGLGSALRAAMS